MTEQEKSNGPFSSIISLFSSVRLTIAVLIVLAILSFIGAVIPQNQPAMQYMMTYGETAYRIMERLGVTDMFGSLPFNVTLVLLALNLVVCTLKRLPAAWRMFRGPEGSLLEKAPKKTKMEKQLHLRASIKTAVEKIRPLLGQPDVEISEAQAVLFANRGRLGLLAPYITHLSILVIIAGALLGNAFGFRGVMWLTKGMTQDQVLSAGYDRTIALGFKIRCDDFVREVYEDTGLDKDYKSTLALLRDNQPEQRQVIEVNHPLLLGSIGVYQQRWGRQVVRLSAEKASGGSAREIRVPLDEYWSLPEEGLLYVPTDYIENASGMGRDFGPMITVEKYQDGKFQESIKLFRDVPDFDRREREEKDGYYFQLLGVDDEEWTGLEVVKDPGLPLIWLGFILVCTGICISFTVFPRRICIRIAAGDDRVDVHIMSVGRKAKGRMEKEIDELAQKIKQTFSIEE